jgi:23S rRNA (uracil1939-C5)-methyltransferase
MKREIVVDQLRRIGGIEHPPVQETVPSQQPYGYRNALQFQVNPEGKLGFTRLRSHEVVPVQECHLPVEAIQQIWKQIELEPGSGVHQVGVRANSDGEVQLILEGDASDLPELSIEELEVSAVHVSQAGKIVLGGAGELWMEVLGKPFRVSAESFFQVNSEMAARLVSEVLSEMGDAHYPVAMDLYAGVGLFSAFIAGRVNRLIAVESSSSACEDFAMNLDEFENIELYEAQVEQALEYLNVGADLVVADPPRSGLGKKVSAALVEMACKKIVYISCDPATMARDGRALAQGGYRLSRVIPFDLFPQTYHIETLSVWVI